MKNVDMRDYGKFMRDKAVTMAMKRKEEYLGARVPKELRDKVITRAREMGIPVSNLIRNTLEAAFGNELMSSSTTQNSDLQKQPIDKFASVIGWKTIELNKTVSCFGCGVELRQGTKASMGLGASEPIVICEACKKRL